VEERLSSYTIDIVVPRTVGTWISELWSRGRFLQKKEHREEERRFMKFLDQGLVQRFSNSSRVGCPDLGFLKRLAQHRIPIREVDPWIDHLGSCGECFADFNRLKLSASKRHGHRLMLYGAVAFAVFVAAGLLWVRAGGRRETSKTVVGISTKHSSAATSEDVPGRGVANARMDRKPFEVTVDVSRTQTRGEKSTNDSQLIRLPARLLQCRMKLPLGSPDGPYFVRIERPVQSKVPTAAQGNATIKDGEVRLDVELDLSNMPAGGYVLSYRHAGESWHHAAISITP